jgi:sec-independent protein translocase protein TatA
MFMNTNFLAFGLGWQEMLFTLLIILILFGAKKLPEMAKGLGQGIKEFKKATKDVNEDIRRAIDSDSDNSNSTHSAS